MARTKKEKPADLRLAPDFWAGCLSHRVVACIEAYQGLEYLAELPRINDVIPSAREYTKLIEAGHFGATGQAVWFGMFMDSFFGEESACKAACDVWDALYPMYSRPEMAHNAINTKFVPITEFRGSGWQCGVDTEGCVRFHTYACSFYPSSGSTKISTYSHTPVEGARMLRPRHATHPAVCEVLRLAAQRLHRADEFKKAMETFQAMFSRPTHTVASIIQAVPGLTGLFRALGVSEWQIEQAMVPSRGKEEFHLSFMRQIVPDFVSTWGTHSTTLLKAAQARENQAASEQLSEYFGSPQAHMQKLFRSAYDHANYA